MASETESLNLVVGLTDNVSGGLAKLGNELNNVGSGQQVAHLQRFKNELGAVHKIAHGLAEEFIGLSRSIPIVGRELGLGLTGLMGTLGPVGLGMAALGGAIAAIALEVNKFATELRNIRNLSTMLGIEPSTLKVFQDRAREVGVSAEVVTSSLQGMKRAMSELYKPGFGTLGESLLPKMERGEGLETRQFLERLKGMTDDERFNAIVEKANNVYQNELNDTKSRLKPEGDKRSASALRAQYLAEFNIDERMIELKNVTAMTREEAKQYNDRADAATEEKNAMGELATELHRLNEDLFASVEAMNALTSLLSGATEVVKKVSPANMPGWAVRLFQYTIPGVGPPLAMYDLYKFLRSLRGTPQGETGPQGLLGPAGMMGATGADDKAVAENTAELKRLNDVLALATAEGGGGGLGGLGGGGGSGPGGGMMRGLGGIPGMGPNGSSVGPGTGPGADSNAPGALGFPTSPSAGEGAQSIESAIGGGFARAGAAAGSVAPMTTGDIRSSLGGEAGGPGVPAGDVGASPDQANRPGYYSGSVDVGGKTFHFGTGGLGRGSMPYGNFNIDLGPTGIGDVGRRIGAVGGITDRPSGNEISDPKYPGHPREGVEIHSASGSQLDHLYTEGCFGVAANEWPAFKAALLEQARNAPGGRLRLSVQPGAHGATATIGPPGTAQRMGINPILPGAERAPSGDAPNAFIMHHTGGRGTPESVIGDWRAHRPGIGTQYIMDRQGVIHDVSKEYGYGGTNNIITGSGAGAGLSNRNIVGMEVIARDDRDVTPAQVEAAKKFIAEKYPGTPVFGHGEVNPGHREASEGMSIVSAIRAQRARGEDAAAADRATLDERVRAGPKVEVNGKLTANVRAPKNTDVSVEGGGAFKKTETNRQMPVENAAAPLGL